MKTPKNGFCIDITVRVVLIKTGNMQVQKCQIANNWILLYSARSLLIQTKHIRICLKFASLFKPLKGLHVK